MDTLTPLIGQQDSFSREYRAELIIKAVKTIRTQRELLDKKDLIILRQDSIIRMYEKATGVQTRIVENLSFILANKEAIDKEKDLQLEQCKDNEKKLESSIKRNKIKNGIIAGLATTIVIFVLFN
ncbi:MAG TPA: hypothetical protein VIK77_02880 [Tissierellaceae bacterium]